MSERTDRARTHSVASVEGSPASAATTPAPTDSPHVWLIVGEKRGDNAQIRNLARAVGWAFVEKTIRVAPAWIDAKPPVRASLAHVDRERSDALEGPWPDLVITAGRRLASVALWIKRASGGHTRVVVVGKPRGRARDFDLIVLASHYVMPAAPNVVRHALPLNQLDFHALAEIKKAWVGRLTLLPRPLTALMVGGPTGGLRFDVETAAELMRRTRQLVDRQRGSLYVTTSRRTPRAVAEFLRHTCTVNDQLHLYEESSPIEENPYQALLALADDFVVTSDSLSMMVELAQLGRPLRIHPLARDAGALERALERSGVLARLSPRTDPIPAGGVTVRLLAAAGLPIHSRDLTAISRRLVETGLAGWLGDPGVEPVRFVDEGLDEVAGRIRALVD